MSLGLSKTPTVVIGGLSNMYGDYTTTFEEYQAQRYEGASTIFGPNELEGFIHEALRLVNDMATNSKSKTLEKQTVSVSITKDIDFFINENQTTEEKLEKQLILILEESNEPGIILHADKSVDIEHVVKVIDIAYRNKYKIVLATKAK